MNSDINVTAASQQLFVNMVMAAWQSHNRRLDDLLAKLSDEQLVKDTAPGRNSGTYLLGHLAAVNDGLIPILGFGEKLYPELESIFLYHADKAGIEFPPVAQLRKYWQEINAKLNSHIGNMNAPDWFEKHALVSEEDFAKEPHRNKLNVLINRTNHQSYHMGQLAYLD